MTNFETVRRPGYAPDNASVGRRGQHTRERILACAAKLFATDGYHGTSIDSIARTVGGSRATVYQYFESKHEILLELAATYRPAVFEHARSLGRLAPDEAGLQELHRWLTEWSVLCDQYAMVFLAFPGVGTIAEGSDANFDTAPEEYTELVAGKLRSAGISGIDPVDAAAAFLRISHMVNLQQFQNMFGLDDNSRITASLAIAMQRLFFPETSDTVIATMGTIASPQAAFMAPDMPEFEVADGDEPDAGNVSPIRQDILSAASALFSARGYYAVSMDDIAAAAEVSRATLYRHFSTKVTLLGELSSWSVLESRHLSVELHDITAGPDSSGVRGWLARYVHFHRTYGGVIRAWYDGAIARQVPGNSVAGGMRGLHRAVLDFLDRYRLPPTMDRGVAAAIFLAVLGRLSEYAALKYPDEKDYDAAGFMLAVLERALLGDGLDVRRRELG